MVFTVDGFDTTEKFHIINVLLYWYANGYIHVEIIVDPEVWIKNQLHVNSGPLTGIWNPSQQPLFANMAELIGTYGSLCAYELYILLHTFVNGRRAKET